MDLIIASLNRFELPHLSAPVHDAVIDSTVGFARTLKNFDEFGTKTRVEQIAFTPTGESPRFTSAYINEFWTAGQRAADNLHEISYRACFKPQLPRFFIERLTEPADVVYDPFMGRGTTLLEAALLGRRPAGNDINPLSLALIRPRLRPPDLDEIERTLQTINWSATAETWDELLVFYHPDTLRELTVLKKYLLEKEAAGELERADDWIRMVALNRLTGHSPGFFSVYTLPPNQAVSIQAQARINEKRKQTPAYRSVPKLIAKKSRSLLKDLAARKCHMLQKLGASAILTNSPAAETRAIPDHSISLVVTSPPFLDVVQYATDNWLRCWFIGVDANEVRLTVPKKLSEWETEMTRVFRELNRVLKPGGHVAFEVGEVRNGTIRLEESVLMCGTDAGLEPLLVLINDQEFTKTANCWGVDNNAKGTNTNRIVLFKKV